ncbi:MAG TPA: PGPGW domain-containing protein [Polyangiaceae bacterium]|nr:PGPGW domain-containing protein [Polyangiaceae bacterium]
MHDWLPEFAERWLRVLLEPQVLVLMGVLSVATFVASLIGVPLFFVRLRDDHFTRKVTPPPANGLRGWLRLLWFLARNLLGLVLVVLGLLMLVLPGQGLLTLLVGLLMLDFPGKRRFERLLIGQPRILAAINRLRRRAGRGPLLSRSSWGPPPPSPNT